MELINNCPRTIKMEKENWNAYGSRLYQKWFVILLWPEHLLILCQMGNHSMPSWPSLCDFRWSDS
jgi:hypothetical protein